LLLAFFSGSAFRHWLNNVIDFIEISRKEKETYRNFLFSFNYGGERCRSWLRHCATRGKVPGSIPGRVIENFQVTYSFCPHSVK